jgi:hypothetical protein
MHVEEKIKTEFLENNIARIIIDTHNSHVLKRCEEIDTGKVFYEVYKNNELIETLSGSEKQLLNSYSYWKRNKKNRKII